MCERERERAFMVFAIAPLMVEDELKYKLYSWTFFEFSITCLDCKFDEDRRFIQYLVLATFRNTIHRDSYLYLLMRTMKETKLFWKNLPDTEYIHIFI